MSRPPQPELPGLILAAGSAVPLAEVASAIEALGATVLRVDARGPGALSSALGRLREQGVTELWLGGHSEGAREVAEFAAAGHACCTGLLLLSYPLRVEGQRDAGPLPAICVQALFVQGTDDLSGSPDDVRAAAAGVAARVRVHAIPGARHDLAGKRCAREIAEAFAEFAGLIPAEAVAIPVTDVFDLHTIAPRDAEAAVEAYLEEAHRLGLTALRIIHGRGIGVRRGMVRRILARTPYVEAFGDAPAEAGGWGATIVDLKRN